MMHLSHFAGLDDYSDRRTRTGLDERVVHSGDGEKRRNAAQTSRRRPVGQDDDLDSVSSRPQRICG